MKTLKLMLALGMFIMFNNSFSQNLNSETKSLPVDKKTNCYIRYYYYPNLQAYFDNLKMVYYYKDNGVWKTDAELPQNYGGYSLFNRARVIITDYDDENPQQFLKTHKKLYPYNSKGRFTYATASYD